MFFSNLRSDYVRKEQWSAVVGSSKLIDIWSEFKWAGTSRNQFRRHLTSWWYWSQNWMQGQFAGNHHVCFMINTICSRNRSFKILQVNPIKHQIWTYLPLEYIRIQIVGCLNLKRSTERKLLNTVTPWTSPTLPWHLQGCCLPSSVRCGWCRKPW